METYHSSGMMGPNFSGFGTFWWDPKAQVYRGLWCDSMTPNGCDASGTTKWDGETLVGMMEGEMNGQKTVIKIHLHQLEARFFRHDYGDGLRCQLH